MYMMLLFGGKGTAIHSRTATELRVRWETGRAQSSCHGELIVANEILPGDHLVQRSRSTSGDNAAAEAGAGLDVFHHLQPENEPVVKVCAIHFNGVHKNDIPGFLSACAAATVSNGTAVSYLGK